MVGRTIWAALLCTAVTPAQALLVWAPATPQGTSHRGTQPLQLRDGSGGRVEYWLPSLQRRPLALKAGRVTPRPSGANNYHALVARRRTGNVHESAVRYLFAFGKPSGHSPSELTAAVKTALELVPDPLPREHWHYETGQRARFVLRYRGRPQAGVAVRLTSSHGSRLEQRTDARGRVRFQLPDDFPSVAPGRRKNPPAELVLAATYRDGRQVYRTTLSAPYYVNPRHWQSNAAAAAVLAAGFFTGLGVLRAAGRRRAGGAA